ncbi:large conductance mechanosensitive channel protein MscL [Clostridium sp. LY3-2]|uniref:large conductance mechanosensitive channel protein MscL n=1 Tax=Clostridium sp. LY3-2 TaxID=2942482 RepID=UPI002152F3F6|nr:large conductance mechanosensitive channel protein MscL [Clostridium sp. LY3-2]MCR6514606.1 large conductance mechanosensitive channel protein MscL [Clostridium sp. LY3-2]
MWKDFKEFAMKGNVVDMAIGVVVGGAFGKIVTSLVNDIIMPLVGLLVGKIDFSNLYINLSGKEYPSLQAAKAAGAATINYGMFLNNLINFLIIAFSIFFVIRQLGKIRSLTSKNEEEVVEETEKECPFCFSKINIEATRCPHCTSILKESAELKEELEEK